MCQLSSLVITIMKSLTSIYAVYMSSQKCCYCDKGTRHWYEGSNYECHAGATEEQKRRHNKFCRDCAEGKSGKSYGEQTGGLVKWPAPSMTPVLFLKDDRAHPPARVDWPLFVSHWRTSIIIIMCVNCIWTSQSVNCYCIVPTEFSNSLYSSWVVVLRIATLYCIGSWTIELTLNFIVHGHSNMCSLFTTTATALCCNRLHFKVCLAGKQWQLGWVGTNGSKLLSLDSLLPSLVVECSPSELSSSDVGSDSGRGRK